MADLTMDKIVSLCKNRGFIFQGSEIYGGLANTWDYGPLGARLKNSIKDTWRKRFVQERKSSYEIDADILMHPRVWEASGHVAGFSDPLLDCKECKTRHRADKLIEEWAHENGKDMIADGMSDKQLTDFIEENKIPCPSCGKTNFISYLSQMNESIVDFRFYTYLPVNKVDGSYSDDEGFYLGNILWRSILVQLKKKFEENNLLSVVKFPLIYQFMSVSEMRETVIHFLPEYAKCIGRPCYFFIDGLDHAARSKDARNSFLSQLPRPEEIGDDFYFVLVGQPINDGYPSWMKDNKGITYYSMPALDTDDVVILLEQSGVAENTVDMENLAKTVISVIGNNVLNIIFAILELKKMVLPLSFEAIEKELNSRFLNKQIDKYYAWIISSQEKSLLLYKIEAIMAFAS